MIYPMMMKVDFAAIRGIGKRPRGLFVTLFVNWMVKPSPMAFFAWLFSRHVFAPWIAPADADQYIAGAIILARVPLVVWGLSDPKRGGHSVFSILHHPGLNHRPEILTDVMEPECRAILQDFFRSRREEN